MNAKAAIVEEITIAAPAARVFAALTDPAQRRRWWGGSRFQVLAAESDLRVGGRWGMSFEAYGRRSSVGGVYREVEPPRRLAFTWLPDWYENPSETLVTFELREESGRTWVRLTHSGLVSEADRASHRGWPDILTWLQAYAEAV
ncbi:MAG: SRPBCC family protein [Terriglobales bacterium]